METLFAIGMMVGLMRSHAEPPKPAIPLAQRQVAQVTAEAEKLRQHHKKSEWLLSY